MVLWAKTLEGNETTRFAPLTLHVVLTSAIWGMIVISIFLHHLSSLLVYTGGLFANLGNALRLSVLEDMRRNHQVREGMRPGSMGTRQSGNISNSYFKF